MKLYLVFALLIVIALGLIYFFYTGWYPVALVDSQPVWAWQWQKEYQSALSYYRDAVDPSELKSASLDGLIENRVIKKGFEALLGDEGQLLLDEKISVYLNNDKLEGAADALFGLSMSEFADLILAPQARREIIQESLKKENRDFEQWLKSQKENTKIYIF